MRRISVLGDMAGESDGAKALRRLVFRLELVGVAALVTSQVLRVVGEGGGGNGGGFLNDVPLAVASTLCLLSICGAGVLAGVSLWRHPLTTKAGEWGLRLAVFNVMLLPTVWLLSWAGSAVGVEFRVGWGMPYFPVWAFSGLAALGLSLTDAGERPQAGMVLPLLLGGALLNFFLGDMVPMP